MENYLEKSSQTVSEKLRSQQLTGLFDKYLVEYFAKQLEASNFLAKDFIRFGADSIVIEIEGERMLKIFEGKKQNNDKGIRPFDLPILEQGEFEKEETAEFPHEGYFIIQPKADTNVNFEETRKFIGEIEKAGYKDVDIGYDGQKQLGYYNGRLYLLDYDAVE